ncbi:hypothetical protein JL721_1031 [Aureococcus anophagefferens]|nr:hypothetical protein JL721_1031 [Aureococcus anophagefferens]
MARYVVAAAALASTAAFQPARPRLAPPMQMVAEDGLRLRSIAPERATEPLVDEALVEEALRSEIADFVEEALGVDEDALVVDGGAAVAPIVVEMDLAKATVDASEGLAGLGGDAIAAVFGDTVRRRLWTKADFMHAHAASGAYFLVGAPLWLLYSHATAAGHLDAVATWRFDGPLETSLLVAGVANALTAIPMARFSSNKMFDVTDLKANGFTFGGAGLTLMSIWIAAWFSGLPGGAARGPAFFLLWASVCAGTTLNWEIMLQQNFEAAEEANKEMATRGGRKTDLERNLCLPDAAMWWAGVVERYPNQGVLGYHYGFASAVGYALSMLSETLRDRKLVSLRVDLIILVVGVFLPMVSVGLDGVLLGDTVTVNPLDYWRQFHDVLPPSQIAEVLGEVVPPPSQIAEVVLVEAL